MVFMKIFIVIVLMAGANCQLGQWGGQGSLGYRGSLYSGDRSQVSGWGAVNPNPLTVSGGADWKHDKGHGASLSVAHQPRGLTQGTLGGTLGLIHTPQHQLSASMSHTKTFDNQFREIGHGSNTAGLGYQFNSKDGKTSVGANAQTTFGREMKPQHQVEVGLTRRWR